MSNWTALIPAKIRTTLYVGFGVLSLAQASILAYSAAVGATAPVWAIGGGAVLGVLGGAFGFVAAGNTNVGGVNVGEVTLQHEFYVNEDGQVKLVVPDEDGYPVGPEHAPTTADTERYER